MNQSFSENQKRFLSAAALFLGQALYMYYVGARAVSLLSILESFHAAEYYSLTIVLGSMSMSVMLPLGGKLGDMFGRKKLFAIGMIGFLLGELVFGTAQRYWQLVLGIVLCGSAYGLAWVQNAALIVDSTPGRPGPRSWAACSWPPPWAPCWGPSWAAGAWNIFPGAPSFSS